MKTLGLIVVGIFGIVGVAASAYFALSAYDSRSTRFASYQDLVRSDLIEHGWVPADLPRSARGIEESHDVSANTGGGSFRYDPADAETISKNCRILRSTERGSKFLCPPFDEASFVIVLRTDGSGNWFLLSDAI